MARGGIGSVQSAIWLSLAVAVGWPAFAFGETVERNLPPAPVSETPQLAPPNLIATKASDKPIDGRLSSLTFLGPGDRVIAPSRAKPGVNVGRIAFIDDPGFSARLAPFLGKPVSLKLIADIEAVVAGWYREKGRPFVSVSTPKQEVTGGVLQVRVIEFHVSARSAPRPAGGCRRTS
jgi:hemolysin activation/secretion protein